MAQFGLPTYIKNSTKELVCFVYNLVITLRRDIQAIFRIPYHVPVTNCKFKRNLFIYSAIESDFK